MSVIWLAQGLTFLWQMERLRGDTGRTRFNQLSDDRARGMHALVCTRNGVVVLAMGLSFTAFDTVVRVVVGDTWRAATAAGAVLVFLAAVRTRKLVAPDVSAALAERGLEPNLGRETSAKRLRRQKQFGFTSLAAYAIGSISSVLGDRNEVPGLLVAGAVATTVAFAALLGLMWASVWVYGDEQKTGTSSRA